MSSSRAPLPVVVLISGSGSNLQALIDAQQNGLPIAIRAVVSNKPEAFGLQRAEQAGIPCEVIQHKEFESREAYDQALMQVIDQYQPGLVVLAGFMRILTADFVRHYLGRMLNIHPSLLPKYRGLNTHQRAIDAGDVEHGVSVHFVTEELDGGPIVAQAKVPVHEGDNAAELAERVQQQEHQLYPLVVGWFAEGRLCWQNDHALFDGQAIHTPILIN